MRVYRLEFPQLDGRWCGPYCAEYLTERAFVVRDHMIAAHDKGDLHRPWPDERIFERSPGPDRYVCGTATLDKLVEWFQGYLVLLLREGGHLAVYDVPAQAIAAQDVGQVVYMQRQAQLLRRASRVYVDPASLVPRMREA
jgi:hypothetical protein